MSAVVYAPVPLRKVVAEPAAVRVTPFTTEVVSVAPPSKAFVRLKIVPSVTAPDMPPKLPALLYCTCVFKPPGVLPPPVPQAIPVEYKRPLPEKVAQPEVLVDTVNAPLTVEEAETRIPFAEPFMRLGKMNPSVRFVILHGTAVVARAVAGKRRAKQAIKMARNFLICCINIKIRGYC